MDLYSAHGREYRRPTPHQAYLFRLFLTLQITMLLGWHDAVDQPDLRASHPGKKK
jgi:hypothetical protein